MRWFIPLLASCTFTAQQRAQDARSETSPTDAPAAGDAVDAQVDAPIDAMVDAAQPATVSFVLGTAVPGSGTSVAIPLAAPIADGDLCVVGVGSNTGASNSVTDTAGDTYTSQGGSVGGQTVFVAANMHASANDSITVRFDQSSGYTIGIAVYRGLAPAAPVEATAAASGTGGTVDSGAAATSHPHDLLVGVVSSSGSIGAGSGFTKDAGGTYSLIAHREVTTSGTYDAIATVVGSSSWSIRLLAIKAND